MSHREIHKYDEKDNGRNESLYQRFYFGIFLGGFDFSSRILSFLSRFFCSVSRFFHRRYYFLVRKRCFYCHGIRQQVYGAGRNPVEFGDSLFYSAAACGAGHSGYIKLFRKYHSLSYRFILLVWL